jgi:hypothetical protein
MDWVMIVPASLIVHWTKQQEFDQVMMAEQSPLTHSGPLQLGTEQVISVPVLAPSSFQIYKYPVFINRTN